ncbi:peptidase M14 [Aquincola sp. S2]|uniref:Peptidase M14 n=1 Tax=Pseudaquabacterium terrae TaxID=2732868 RepID=A0ABX2ENP1_9BURK|nr:M14 family zinc carboxypeptidase [Aquabacterium terrae]NRF70266.1 peptidase M14 [Aquabacterium terrae]
MARWPVLAVVFAAAAAAGGAFAQFDPEKVVRETPAVAERYPDPPVRYDTPAFREGRADFTTHAEVMAFAERLAAGTAHLKLSEAGTSQRGRPVPLLTLTAQGRIDPALPTVLVIGQQHGNEPAGGEAVLALAQLFAGPRSGLLDRVNLLLLPRANPDGAEAFVRTTPNGIDVNRDHLLLRTPEGQAIADVLARHRPQVVLDLHEFTVAGRWIEKFGALQKVDAQLQPATVGNLDPGLSAATRREFVERLHAAWATQGYSSDDYQTGSSDPKDRVVSMGGVQPDTGRNTAGLRPAVSLLVEVRGIGLGRAHLLRRVHAHVVAAASVIDTAAALGPRLLALVEQAGRDTAAQACQGELVIAARHSNTRRRIVLLDPRSGADLPLEVDWRAAEPLQVERTRPRPCGYLFDAAQAPAALERLHLLGARWQRVAVPGRWAVERYVVGAEASGQRQDSRGAIDDGGGPPVRLLQVRTEAADEPIGAGMVYVPLDQPLAGLIAAALEPDSQNSFAANHLLDLDMARLRRVMQRPPAQALGDPVKPSSINAGCTTTFP